MPYAPRPAPSPVVAALVAAGVITRDDRVVDLGCGTGTDAVALARWGVRSVTGVDKDRRALAAARRRAKAARVARHVSFVHGDVTRLGDAFQARSFDVALDTLLANNLRADEIEAYARGVSRILARGGLLVVQERVHRWAHESEGKDVLPMPPLLARFDFGSTVTTAVPEAPLGLRDPHFARVAVSVGRNRA